MAIGELTLDSLFTTTSGEVSPSTECWLVVGDSCKDVITSPTAGGEVTLLMMSISLLMLSWVVVPYDLTVRVTTFERSSSTIGVAFYTKSNSPIRKKRKKKER